ncbi:hypothetical protein [Pseudocolwellia sp. HL-MZ7]|uniref:hypothetical protein n=1 Tax=Pseudocolwellia sp. HL-MZ7 TaxID=3400627 RepID=UPI003CE88305
MLVLGFALLLLWLGQLAESIIEDKVIVREVALVSLPPPPPPSVSQAASSKPLPSLMVQGAGVAIQAVEIQIESSLDLTTPDAPNVKMSTPQWQPMSVNFDAFSLDQLDGLPTLLTKVKAKLPKSLARELSLQNIDTFVVKLDVLIDESGNVSLIDIVQNPYSELTPQINQIIRSSRFSSPKKEGEIVSARFIWPIEFTP